MKFTQIQSLKNIAHIINCSYIGNENLKITGMNEIHVIEEGEVVFVDHPKYYDKALNSKASVIIINKKVNCPKGKALLISDDPFRDFNKLTQYFNTFIKSDKSISDTCNIGKNTIIQPNVFIGNNVVIGDNCVIHPNVTIYDNMVIGNNITIHANTVIGADAFYYKNRTTEYDKLISSGRVVIEDNVDIGASCTIDKGVTGDTTIKKGTKIDNSVHIGHDTVVGEMCLIASQVGVAGCVIIENNVTIWGQVGISSDITIGQNVIILAQSGVSKSLKANKTYFGYPAEEIKSKYKELATIRRIVKEYK